MRALLGVVPRWHGSPRSVSLSRILHDPPVAVPQPVASSAPEAARPAGSPRSAMSYPGAVPVFEARMGDAAPCGDGVAVVGGHGDGAPVAGRRF
jgi:hypothetical protein